MSGFLDLYEPIDIIGNGSFGIIRKVRRKSDGLIFARKELNFERMNERDRKQIVAEVNILKDLHHDHIVKYHDRYVDRDAGILYILMEYCGGGDLSTVIKQTQKSGRLIPEDTIWNYFFQILLALQHCHHPNGHSRSGSACGSESECGGKERRAQVLHRDIKPDNVFLDEANRVKLGDFGLSKALPQASFANTYVGTPYYMSPELMQEKAYDSKSDIWSLGCLIYELCALKPPFHEAKTHTELSIFIRNGRIPPLPRGYSQSLSSVIKAMLNLNPAMRPSASQLLQHERLELVMKVSETEKMLSTVKVHRATVSAKERELAAREQELLSRESSLMSLVTEKDAEIAHLRTLVSQHEQAIEEAVRRREEELKVQVMAHQAEAIAAQARREEELKCAVMQREEMFFEEWRRVELATKEREEWVMKKQEELQQEEVRVDKLREVLEEKVRAWEAKEKEMTIGKGRRDKNPLEEVKNLLARMTNEESPPSQLLPTPKARPLNRQLQTPLPCNNANAFTIGSAMRGVVFTNTGESLTTPAPGNVLLATPSSTDVANLFLNSPKVPLDFSIIFDRPSISEGKQVDDSEDESDHSPPPSPSKRERPRPSSAGSNGGIPSASSSTSTAVPSDSTPQASRPTRLRRPSIRSSSAAKAPYKSTKSTSQPDPSVQPLSHPHLSVTRSASISTIISLPPAPVYDLNDEENLPSPFLKRTLSNAEMSSKKSGKGVTKRSSTAHLLRAVAVHNAAAKTTTNGSAASAPNGSNDATRPALATARKASEDARKALNKS